MTANLHMNVYAGDNAVAVEKSKEGDTYFLELSETHVSQTGYHQKNTVCAFMTRAQLEELRFVIERVMADETALELPAIVSNGSEYRGTEEWASEQI